MPSGKPRKITKDRKNDHIRICLEKDVSYSKETGFGKLEFRHNALPEIDFGDIDCSCDFLGKKMDFPLMVAAITGGTKKSFGINKNIAMACESLGLGMGLGSQRAMIEDPGTSYSYQIRHLAPNIPLLGNIGAVQLKEYDVDMIIDAVKQVGADGIAVHLNSAQEIAQDEGSYNWSGVLDEIKKLAKKAKFPVVAKEVGCGISGEAAKQLVSAGVKAIDVSGAGGTSWIRVDSYRSKRYVDNFMEWGIPTAVALREVAGKVRVPVIASGGIRSGLDVAKAIAMGSSISGLALPVLRPATKGWKEVSKYLERIIFELKVTMFLLGAENLKELGNRELFEKNI